MKSFIVKPHECLYQKIKRHIIFQQIRLYFKKNQLYLFKNSAALCSFFLVAATGRLGLSFRILYRHILAVLRWRGDGFAVELKAVSSHRSPKSRVAARFLREALWNKSGAGAPQSKDGFAVR